MRVKRKLGSLINARSDHGAGGILVVNREAIDSAMILPSKVELVILINFRTIAPFDLALRAICLSFLLVLSVYLHRHRLNLFKRRRLFPLYATRVMKFSIDLNILHMHVQNWIPPTASLKKSNKISSRLSRDKLFVRLRRKYLLILFIIW